MADLYANFELFVKNNGLFQAKNSLLVGVSGGADSILLAHFLHKQIIQFEVAHCNFKLRAKESDAEEDFVRQFCKERKLKFHVKHFDTKAYAREKGVSTQMAARDIRYAWFEELRKGQKLDFIAIATNASDSVESFFINLSRGTGLHGLTGIKAKNGNIIRPLLFADKDAVRYYALQQGIAFKTDSSNLKNDYTRNKIRNQIIPLFYEINQSFLQSMLQNIERLNETNNFLQYAIEKEKTKAVSRTTKGVCVDVSKIIPAHLPFVLFEILKEFQFNSTQIQNILQAETQSGAYFYSPSHKLLKNRNELIIEEINSELLILPESISPLFPSITLNRKVQHLLIENMELSQKTSIAILDYTKLQFPLFFRRVEKGDKFMPLGMKNYKKISDFFIDNKVSQLDKEKAMVLVDATNQIVWLCHYRIDNNFKVTENTSSVLYIELVNA